MLDEKDPLDSFLIIENNRPSAEELERIKKYSDENLETISSKIGLKENLDDEEKRNIIVNLIGALDYYIHEIIIWGLVQITLNKFPKGKNYEKQKVELEYRYIKMAFEDKDIFNEVELKKTIIENIRRNTYQKWQSIKVGLELILPKKVLEKISDLTSGKNGVAIFQTNKLDELANKRHLIVHHFDREYSNNSSRNTLDIDCNESFILIKTVIDSIHKIIVEYDETQPENEDE
ncbi:MULTISPECIES: hypothetical protein [unclassified Fusobacterium]|uniref:hypothetical protein n=1 Tax=Fusobacterium sp. TaxID=68766 RepID=UPI0025BD0E95|nr:hypothetical protein [Fusobacterium sp.]